MQASTRTDLISAFQRAMRDLASDDDASIVTTNYDGLPASAVVVITGPKATADILKAVNKVMDRWEHKRARGQV